MVAMPQYPSPSWRAILDVLSMIDALGDGANGELVFGDSTPVQGRICIEDGRVCWATARVLSKRLTGALREHSALSDADFSAFYERCRAEQMPIGQTLVEHGHLPGEALFELLIEHSAESIVELCGLHTKIQWVVKAPRGHDVDFTFSASEMLFEICRREYGAAEEEALAELAPFSGAGKNSAVFLLETQQSLALPLIANEPRAFFVRDLLKLGRWSTAIIAASLELGAEQKYHFALGRAPSEAYAIVVWRRGSLLYAVVCEDAAALSSVAAVALRG